MFPAVIWSFYVIRVKYSNETYLKVTLLVKDGQRRLSKIK